MSREALRALGLRGGGLDQHDVGVRGHGVRPLHVEAGLGAPAVAVAGRAEVVVAAGAVDRSLRLDHLERGRVGSPSPESNVARSSRMVGEPKASTITIVSPLALDPGE